MLAWIESLPAMATLLTIATIALWASGRLPEYLTALLFFSVATIFDVVGRDVIFSGFSSAAFWLILSGYVMGIALKKSGLADRAAGKLSVHLAGSYIRVTVGVVLLTYVLAYFMPSNMGRIALLMPIVMVLADRLGFEPGSRGRIGMALAVGFGTYQLSTSILPANVPNLVMAGAIESAYGLQLAYLPYLFLHTPVLGVLKGVLLVACIAVLFRDPPRRTPQREPARPFSAAEIRLCVLLAITLAFWLTDGWHGISPAWIGLAAACICLLPRIGSVTGDEFATQVNFRTCIYVAGILGLAAMVAASGLGERVSEAVLGIVPIDPAKPFFNFMAMTGISVVLGVVVTANGLPALYTPLAGTLADASGFPLLTTLMIQVIGYATPLLPFQAAPIVVAMGMGRVPARAGMVLCLIMAAVTFAVLVPLDYLWFQAIGAFDR